MSDNRPAPAAPLPRAIPSTLGDPEPLAYTMREVAPGVFEYLYLKLQRGAQEPEEETPCVLRSPR